MADTTVPAKSDNAKWPFPVSLPQRFATHYDKYRARGGINDVVADAAAFAGGDRLTDIARLVFFWLAFDQIVKERVAGDIVELGVYTGHTAAVLARKARELNRNAFLLDTFEGFDARDFEGPDSGRRKQFADTSLEAVRARVGSENTIYIKGYFPATAEQLPIDGRYALVHIDCDLYAPIFSALEYFYPRLSPGGFLIVHDYSSMAWAGADKAVDNFFADKPEAVIPLPDSAGSAVIRKARQTGEASNWMLAKQSLELEKWYPAANGALADLLGEGWSGPENWGVWGVGISHVLNVGPADTKIKEFEIDIHCRAALTADRPNQTVDVLVNGIPYATWTFSHEKNLETRSIHVAGSSGSSGRSVVSLEFRPHIVEVVPEVKSSMGSGRKLGMALYRLRLRSNI